jgi:hypothetical protein
MQQVLTQALLPQEVTFQFRQEVQRRSDIHLKVNRDPRLSVSQVFRLSQQWMAYKGVLTTLQDMGRYPQPKTLFQWD